MKILIFAGYFYPHKGGLEQYVLNLSNSLSKKHKVTIICPRTDNSKIFEQKNNLKIIRLPSIDFMRVYPLIYSKKPLNSISNENFDLIITNTRFFHTTLIGRGYAKRKNIPWIHIEHGTSLVKTNNPLLFLGSRIFDFTFGRIILNTAPRIITISDSAKKFVKKLSKNKNIITIPNGIYLKNLPKYKPKKTVKKIIFVGRLIYAKGIQDLILAISKIKNKKLSLTIVGNGPYKKELEDLTKKLNLNDRITFTGEKTKKEVLNILAESDLFINPSYSEGLPTSVLEAGAVGLPVIATDVGGTKEIIQSKKTGLLIKEKNPEELKKVIEFMTKNHKQRTIYIKYLNKIVKTKFNWEKIIKQWEKLLIEIKD